MSRKNDLAPTKLNEQREVPKHMGGMFSPLAQYPGVGYGEVFQKGRVQDALPEKEPKPLQEKNKVFIRTNKPMESNREHSYTSALLLVEIEGNARMDRSFLREAGFTRIQVLTSGILAGRFLDIQSKEQSSEAVDVVFCHPRLDDMSAPQFIELIRLSPLLKNIPIIAIAGSSEEGILFQSMGSGFTNILTRPYSLHDLQSSLSRAQESQQNSLQLESSMYPKSQKEFDLALKTLEGYKGQNAKTFMYFNEGLKLLKEKSWDMAIVALSKVLYNQELKGEAEYGLAVAWQGKNNPEKYTYFMNEACLSLVRAQKWARARHAYSKLVQVMPHALNPFVRTAEGLIRGQNFRDAGATLLLGIELSNKRETLERIARACFYTENVEFTLDRIQKNFTAPELKALVAALPQELERLNQGHAVALEKKRHERALLRKELKSLPKKSDPFNLSPFGAGERNDGAGKSSRSSLSGVDLLESESSRKAVDFLPFNEDEDELENQAKSPKKGLGLFSSRKKGKKTSKKSTQKNIKDEKSIQLQEHDLEVDFFPKQLNEIATVIKTTWKLMKGK